MERRLPPDRHGGPVRAIHHLVAPLADSATVTHTQDIAGDLTRRDGSSAVVSLIGSSLRRGDVGSAIHDSTLPTAATPGTRTSPTATRTTGTATTESGLVPSAEYAEAVRHADLTLQDVVRAYVDCRRHKRNKPSALRFEESLEANLIQLYEDLRDGSYHIDTSICFVITRPKPREVWAADFRDRVVHHLLCNRVAPRFYAAFVPDSCACIPGRGTLYAAERLEAKVRSITQNWSRPAFYLKVDLANFFVTIDKRIVRNLLAERIHEPWWMQLAEQLLFHDPRPGIRIQSGRERLQLIPPHKSLFRQPAHLGLPIGNLSSQFFANVYLDVLDQHVKHRIGVRHYIRYVDDMVLLHESAQWLNDAKAQMEAVLAERLGLKLNPRKTIIQPVDRGIDFAGQVIKPWRRIVRRRTVNEALHRVEHADLDQLFESVNSYFGLLRQASHSRGDRARLTRIALRRGLSVDYRMTKAHKRGRVA